MIDKNDSVLMKQLLKYKAELTDKIDKESKDVADICNQLLSKWNQIKDLRKVRNFNSTSIIFK